jgi:hypothetical protein
MKFDKLTEAYMNVVKESSLNLYRVYLDRPGAGWEEYIKATSPEKALKIANSKNTQKTTIDSVEQLPDNYLKNKEKAQTDNDNFEKEKQELINNWTKDKEALEAKYNIEKYSTNWSAWEIR